MKARAPGSPGDKLQRHASNLGLSDVRPALIHGPPMGAARRRHQETSTVTINLASLRCRSPKTYSDSVFHVGNTNFAASASVGSAPEAPKELLKLRTVTGYIRVAGPDRNGRPTDRMPILRRGASILLVAEIVSPRKHRRTGFTTVFLHFSSFEFASFLSRRLNWTPPGGPGFQFKARPADSHTQGGPVWADLRIRLQANARIFARGRSRWYAQVHARPFDHRASGRCRTW